MCFIISVFFLPFFSPSFSMLEILVHDVICQLFKLTETYSWRKRFSVFSFNDKESDWFHFKRKIKEYLWPTRACSHNNLEMKHGWELSAMVGCTYPTGQAFEKVAEIQNSGNYRTPQNNKCIDSL